MFPSENANEMYSCLNILVEKVNGLGLTQMQPSDVVRKILSVLPIDKYGHIVTVLHQSDLLLLRQLKYWGRSMHMRCTCTSLLKMAPLLPKKNLVFKAGQEKRGK